MKMTLYGQAEFYYALSCEKTQMLEEKGIITADQRRRIDELDRKAIYEMYPSIDDLETYANEDADGIADADDAENAETIKAAAV